MFAVGVVYIVSITWRKGPEKPKCCRAEDNQAKLMSKAFSGILWSLVVLFGVFEDCENLIYVGEMDRPSVKPA